ncbi:MAG: hypothetical protein EOO55_02845 [Hymenobacter sp.]|nr:MAG: hypothetical protein EOO55_02845 [Hymenobacter sp.]
MCYRKHLRQVRHARRRAKAQQRALLALELEGFVALTLHTVTATLTVPIEREVGAQVADTLREALRERRRALKTEATQLRRDGGENAYRRDYARAEPVAPPSTPTASSPFGDSSALPLPPDGAPALQS